MHDSSFPQSEEAPDARTARAEAALRYEERAKLGFRKRKAHGGSDPWTDPEVHAVDHEQSLGELWGAYLGGVAVVFGILAFFWLPLFSGTVALFAGGAGTIAGGNSVKIARIGLIIACFGYFIGMLIALTWKLPVFF